MDKMKKNECDHITAIDACIPKIRELDKSTFPQLFVYRNSHGFKPGEIFAEGSYECRYCPDCGQKL